MSSLRKRALITAGVLLLVLAISPVAMAYIGPGAGIAFVTTFFALLTTLLVLAVGLMDQVGFGGGDGVVASRLGGHAVDRVVDSEYHGLGDGSPCQGCRTDRSVGLMQRLGVRGDPLCVGCG